MKIIKYTADDGKVLYDVQGLTPNAYAAIVSAIQTLSDDNSKGVLSSNADGLLRKFNEFERANVDAAIKRTQEGKL